MGFLRRLVGPRVPAWASFLDARQYARFEELLGAEMTRRGWAFTQVDDGLRAESPDLPDGASEFGLTNIAQLCGRIDEADWPTAIREHFDNITRAWADDAAIRGSFETARPYLKLRIYPRDPVVEQNVVASPLTPELVAVLVLDLPTTVATISRADVADWPPQDELFAIARENLRAEAAPARQSLDAGGAAVEAELGDSFFVASRILLLPEVFDLSGAQGALVAVPTRHALLIHPIRDMGAIRAINSMVAVAHGLFRDGPGSLVPTVFWWHAGALTAIPASFDGRSVTVEPPEAFVELLNGLPAEAGSS